MACFKLNNSVALYNLVLTPPLHCKVFLSINSDELLSIFSLTSGIMVPLMQLFHGWSAVMFGVFCKCLWAIGKETQLNIYMCNIMLVSKQGVHFFKHVLKKYLEIIQQQMTLTTYLKCVKPNVFIIPQYFCQGQSVLDLSFLIHIKCTMLNESVALESKRSPWAPDDRAPTPDVELQRLPVFVCPPLWNMWF